MRGEITEYDVKVLELAALKGVFTDVVEDQVSYVNAPLLAAERGTAVRLVTDPESPDHRNLITLRGTLADGVAGLGAAARSIGINQRERLVEVNGFDVDIEPTDHLAFFTLRGPARAWSARSAGSSATPGSTSPACRSPATPRAVRRWSRSRSTRPSRAETLAEIEAAIDAASVRAVDLA